MENRKHALVLTGELLPGSDAARAWPEVAKFFRIDDARLKSDVLARVPMTIKESEDLGDLEKRRASLGALGVASEIHALSGKSCFALIDNVPRGPLPRRSCARCGPGNPTTTAGTVWAASRRLDRSIRQK